MGHAHQELGPDHGEAGRQELGPETWEVSVSSSSQTTTQQVDDAMDVIADVLVGNLVVEASGHEPVFNVWLDGAFTGALLLQARTSALETVVGFNRQLAQLKSNTHSHTHNCHTN